MNHLHADAEDILSARLRPASSRLFPQSRHEWLTQPVGLTCTSTLPPASNGALLQLRVREQPTLDATAAASSSSSSDPAADSSKDAADDDMHIYPARVRTWAVCNWSEPHARPLQWMGVELSNRPPREEPSTRQHKAQQQEASLPARLQWRLQHYFVRERAVRRRDRGERGEAGERAMDSSLSLRWRVAEEPTVAGAVDPSLSAHVTFHGSVVTNLQAAARAQPDAAVPVDRLVAATGSVGVQTAAAAVRVVDGVAQAVPANQFRAELFASSDEHLTGMSLLQTFQHGDGRGLAWTNAARDWVASLWPAQLPRLQMYSTSVGLEYAWVRAAKDYTAGFGAVHQFRWLPPAASGSSSALATADRLSAAAPRSAASAPSPSLPPATVSLSAQAMGHAVASLHVPLTRRLSAATQAHVQLTNLEALGRVGLRCALNHAQSVALAGDSRGGLHLALRSRRRPATPIRRSTPLPWLAWIMRHATTVELRVQAFPLLPALLPAWNVPQTSVVGSSYSPDAMRAMQSPHLHIGGSIEFKF